MSDKVISFIWTAVGILMLLGYTAFGSGDISKGENVIMGQIWLVGGVLLATLAEIKDKL